MSRNRSINYLLVLLIAAAVLIAYSAIADNGPVKTAVRDTGSTVGMLTLDPPEEFIVVEESATGARRLFKKEAYAPLKKEGLEFIETATISELEYKTRPPLAGEKPGPGEFELIGISGKRAVLFKIEAPAAKPLPEPEYFDDDPDLPVEVIVEDEEEKKEITAKRLASSLFLKIKSKKISDTEWEIDLPSTLDAASNFAAVLQIVTDKIAQIIDPEAPTRIYFKSSLGKGRLGPDGLLIESLNARIRKKSGLKEDDLIKTVAGRTLTSIQDVSAAFSALSGEARSVSVTLAREDEDLTHIYVIK
jgi:hypothetical protein